MTDPLKDLQKLKDLFPDMEPYIPDPSELKKEEGDEKDLLTPQAKALMKLYVSRDKKHRGGKQVTLIEGHTGPEKASIELLSKLKSMCSAGGSFKGGELIVQGDHVRKVIDYLKKAGYKQTKQKGG